MRKSVLISACITRKGKELERFRKSLSSMNFDLQDEYALATFHQVDQDLPDAQNKIADFFLDGRYDYLLLVDDDQWGFTPEMFQCLMKADALVATMKTYSRHYPYACTLMRKINENVYVGIENGKGYQEVDMCGFPMTLIKRELFSHLEPPYFTPVEINGRDWHTDVPFFERLAEKGIKPIGCFQHCLNHAHVTEDNVWELRRKESNSAKNRIMLEALIK